ncbi:MAG: SLBB domain-containing protein [Ignavibacteriaceae bacterium]
MKKYFVILLLLSASLNYAQDMLNNANKLNQSNFLGGGVISVTIGGDFVVNGTFPALLTERVDQFVTRIYDQTKEKALANITSNTELLIKVKKQLDDYSLRDIKLKRENGEVIKLDLLKFRTNGDLAEDPYLKNDDVLIFAPADLERNFFTISGAVNKPGKFHFVDGDKLSDAIELAQGINKAYENVDSANIDRLSYDGEKLTSIKVQINSHFDLQRGDRIVVLAKETERKEFSAYVVGEVNSPGEIPISKDNTTLKQVIEAAGGIKPTASLENSKLFTGNIVPMLLEQQFGIKIKDNQDILGIELPDKLVKFENLLMSRMSNMTYEDTAYFFIENRLRILNEGSAVDFTKINNDTSQAAKYIVHNGDVIIIPRKIHKVYVFGQVVNPGYVNYKEGEDFRYYIQKAGGYGEYAESEDEVMIIKNSTKNWISPTEKKVTIEEGDNIWVPKKLLRPFNYYVGLVGSYFSIVASIATLILLLYQFKK